MPVAVAGNKLHVMSGDIAKKSLGRLSSAKVNSSIRVSHDLRNSHVFRGNRNLAEEAASSEATNLQFVAASSANTQSLKADGLTSPTN